jgi:hypothetical protein
MAQTEAGNPSGQNQPTEAVGPTQGSDRFGLGLPSQSSLDLASEIVRDYGRAPYSDGTLWNQHVVKVAEMLDAEQRRSLVSLRESAYQLASKWRKRENLGTNDLWLCADELEILIAEKL